MIMGAKAVYIVMWAAFVWSRKRLEASSIIRACLSASLIRDDDTFIATALAVAISTNPLLR